jgi:DNA sulfur modification protein DndB
MGEEFTTVTKEFEHETVAQAREAAVDDAASSGGRVYPCLVFRQGGRLMVTTSFPFTFVARQVRLDSAVKGGNPRNSTNRPLMPDHVRNIRDYLIKNRNEYILPPVTLNVRQMPQVYVQKSNSPVRSGFLVVGDATMFDVTDGQHRIAAIAGSAATKPAVPPLLTEAPEFENDSMSVLIVVEEEISRIHQDFADAAQTKQIPASLLAAFNTREPVNKVLTTIVDRSEFFKGRVDETSKTLPKLSQSVFLLNNVRAFVKELLVGDYAIAEDALARYTEKLLSTPEQRELFVNRALQLIDVLTAKLEPWNEIVKISVDDTMASRIPDLRKNYISLTATGLVIIGRVAFEINKWLPEAERFSKYIELASNVDWKREAEIWQGSIILEGGKLVTNRAPVALAAQRVKELLGLADLQAVKDAQTASVAA